MGKARQRRDNKRREQQSVNAEVAFDGLRNMSTKYLGAARFIELAPPGIQFRQFANVDHITNITFANKIETIQVPIEGTGAPEVLDPEDSSIIEPMVPPETKPEQRIIGWTVTISVGGQNNEFTFSNLEVGTRYYHSILDSIITLGVPCSVKPLIQIEKTIKPDVSEEAVADAVAEGLEVNEDHDDQDLIDELQEIADEQTEEVPKDPTQH